MTKLRLLLVMILIGWEGGVNSLNQSKSEVKRNQSNRGLLSTLNKVKNSLMSSMMILTILSFSTETTTSTLYRWFTFNFHFRKDVSCSQTTWSSRNFGGWQLGGCFCKNGDVITHFQQKMMIAFKKRHKCHCRQYFSGTSSDQLFVIENSIR